MHVRPHFREPRIGRFFVEDKNCVYGVECANDFRSFTLRDDWSRSSFDRSHGCIRIDADDQNVTLLSRCFEVANVPYVHNVEATVRRDYCLALTPRRTHKSKYF